MRPETRPILGLAGVATLLALGLSAELMLPVDGGTAPPVTPGTIETPADAAPYVPATASALRDRPLFSASRRPAPIVTANLAGEAPRPAPAPPPVPATQLTLLGIVAGPSARIAVIRLPNGPVPLHVSEGDRVDRWEVRHIDADHVTLAAGAVEQVLALPTGSLHPPAARPPVKH